MTTHRDMLREAMKPISQNPVLGRRDAVLCLRCLVEVPGDKIFEPARCCDGKCPLKTKHGRGTK